MYNYVCYRAIIMYAEKFPERRVPTHKIFLHLASLVLIAQVPYATSYIRSHKEIDGRDRIALSVENVEAVLC